MKKILLALVLASLPSLAQAQQIPWPSGVTPPVIAFGTTFRLQTAFPTCANAGTVLQGGTTPQCSGIINLASGPGQIMIGPGNADGNLLVTDSGASFFGMLQLGGTAASNMALKVVASGIEIRNGNDTASKGLVASVVSLSGKFTSYNGVTPAGWGAAIPQAQARATAVVNTGTASAATYTVGAADGTFLVGCNVLVTVSTTHSFSCDVTYTDEGNTARTLVLPMAQPAGGAFVATGLITNGTGAGPYHSPTMTIRAKAATAITVRTSAGGTFTTVTYNIDGTIIQVG